LRRSQLAGEGEGEGAVEVAVAARHAPMPGEAAATDANVVRVAALVGGATDAVDALRGSRQGATRAS
jgi:hypothetical protein